MEYGQAVLILINAISKCFQDLARSNIMYIILKAVWLIIRVYCHLILIKFYDKHNQYVMNYFADNKSVLYNLEGKLIIGELLTR